MFQGFIRYDRSRVTKMFQSLYQDLKYACRSLRINPIFTCVVSCVLALGIGANTALFTVVNKVLLEPLPFYESERLVDVHETKNGWGFSPSYPNFQDWCRMSRSFESLAFALIYRQTLPGESGAERIPVAFVSGSFFTPTGFSHRSAACSPIRKTAREQSRWRYWPRIFGRRGWAPIPAYSAKPSRSNGKFT